MPNPTYNPLLAQQFAWFESMCLQVHKIVKADTPNSSALTVLEMGADIGTKLVIKYGIGKSAEDLSTQTLTSLPPTLTARQITLFFNKHDPQALTTIASKFLSYSGQEVYDHAVAGPQAKEFLDMASKNIAEFVAYAAKITEIANEAQARIALAKALYNQNKVNHND